MSFSVNERRRRRFITTLEKHVKSPLYCIALGQSGELWLIPSPERRPISGTCKYFNDDDDEVLLTQLSEKKEQTMPNYIKQVPTRFYIQGCRDLISF